MRVILATLLALVLAQPVAARASLALVGEPVYAGTVTFTVVQKATVRPWVGLRCNQDGALVLDGYVGVFAGSLQPDAILAGPYWPGGAASCEARLIDWDTGRQRILATLVFEVTA